MKTILILDDDPTILAVMKRLLDDRGYQALVATDPQVFFGLYQSQRIDLVLLDIRMPVKNGFEVFKDLVSGEHPPVLFVTGDATSFSVDSKTALDLWRSEFVKGTTDILYKPFNCGVLYEKVAALIGGPGETS